MIWPNAVATLLVAVSAAEAFTPASQSNLPVPTTRTLDSRRSKTRVANDDMLTETQMLVEPFYIPDTSVFLDGIVESSLLLDQTTEEEDPGREIFLAAIATTTPEELAADTGLNGSEQDDNSVEITVMSFASRNIGLTDEARSSVISVLAASEKAVQAADASLPQDLIEKLDFSTSWGSNGTTTVGPISTLAKSKPPFEIVGVPGTTTAAKIVAPSVKKILTFAIPAIGVWLCGPLLSLIDTSAVGLLSGTTQQAALNPAVAVTDYAALLLVSFYVVAFLMGGYHAP
jgi:hypothetical protein